MKRFLSRLLSYTMWPVLVALGSIALAGCGSARRGMPVQPPLEVSSVRVAEGQRVFMQFCNGCHPGGEAGVGVALNNKPLPGLAIHLQVRNGFGAMPAFSEEVIGDAQLDALIAYLKELRRHDG
ncbi:MAG: c-type cytochrome [Rhodothermales bacterium]